MDLEFALSDALPPLAWCAIVEAGGHVRMRHGSAVETSSDAFVEGAWNGEFERMNFDEVTALIGSGGRLRGDSVLFSSPFHPLECLYLLRTSDRLLVSNSLAFLFVEAGDRPDIQYYDYFFAILKHAQQTVPNLPVVLPTEAGHQVRPFHSCNLVVRPNLTYQEVAKILPPAPNSYADWHRSLVDTVAAVARNAADPARQSTYRLVSALSTGYDSTATAAIAAQAGGKEAVTFIKSSTSGGDLVPDSGVDIGRHLGMSVTEYDRTDVRNLPGFPEAEYFANPSNLSDVPLGVMAQQLAGALFTTGRYGQDLLGATLRPDLNEPENIGLAGRGGTEFRIRAKHLKFPIFYLGAAHGRQLHRIAHSAEMQPWVVNSWKYDKPIPRRIAEEAGVPRELFGQRKIGGGGRGLRALNEASEKDFQEFFETEVPASIRRELDPRHQIERDREHFRMKRLRYMFTSHRLTRPFVRFLPFNHWHAMWKSVNLYRFHWGFQRVHTRYKV